MPRADAAKLIGENLHAIPGPDGKPRRLLQYSTAGKSPDQQQDISRRALDIGNCIIGLLESNGYEIRHRSDPAPELREGEYTVVESHCAHCGQKVLELSHLHRDPHRANVMKATLHKPALESIGHPHACWR